MRRARVAYGGAIHEAIEWVNQLKLADGRVVKEEEIMWLTPIEPRTVFALGLNYADHAAELSFDAPSDPLVFLKGPNTLIGHQAYTRRPADVTYMHYECELAVIIGETARNVQKEDAYKYVKGYSVANDYAIRDYLENYYRPNLRVKNRDICTPLGPWLVDVMDIADPMNLRLTTHVNSELVQEGTTADMIFDIPSIIEYLSSFMTLSENDVILTGTPKGSVNTVVGDVVVTEIEGIGRLVNTIIGDEAFTNR
ncbi:fumarylacetoacetate hydrolase family protein [Psychrobacillus sp. FJAT-21963]|uniref:fumarylacetoacetate hydrolase family protein n=1 Tax=Psychrobacillus sp. FJAT-21963 TaxID=1712028 RepID=UPI0006FF1529|nr:fumarylacetoacetate hydrolase family protein [Psychrobacillus sp. FJAT-21963]KQL33622.1 2-hydroxyhepta-2,4-diene-1,7-dioate isomerase [Psychrobacillus sp. FJAT-21963]